MSLTIVPARKLGSQGLKAPIQGLGCMGMTLGVLGYKSADGSHAGEEESIKTIHRALELGVSFLDTSDAYGPFTNEEIVGRQLAGEAVPMFFGACSCGPGAKPCALVQQGLRFNLLPRAASEFEQIQAKSGTVRQQALLH